MNYKGDLPIVVLAGGEGTRLNFLSHRGAKILSPIGRDIFMNYFVKNLCLLGFTEIYFIVHKSSIEVTNYWESIKNQFDVDVTFLFDGENKLGTGGTLVKNHNVLPDFFWLTYGDTLLNWDILEAQKKFIESNTESLITVIRKEKVNEIPNILIENKKIVSYSKQISINNNYVDYGALILNKKILKKYEITDFDLEIIINDLIKNGTVDYFEVEKVFHEMGNNKSYQKLNDLLLIKTVEDLWNE